MKDIKSERVKNSIRLLIGIAILTCVLFVGDLIVNKNFNIKEAISNLSSSNSKFQDTYNGVYTYEEALDSKVNAYTGCSFSSINNYILVINDEYTVFRSSCMGTYKKATGKTEDLNIVEGEKSYSIKYEEHVYERDYNVLTISENNNIANQGNSKLDLNSLSEIAKETEFEGNYYAINRKVNGLTTDIYATFEHISGDNFNLSFIYKKSNTIYSYLVRDLDTMPIFYTFGGNLAMIERGVNGDKYSYTFKVLDKENVNYTLDSKLPITVNDEILDTSKSIFVVFDSANRYFKMFIGNDKKFCVVDGNDNKPAYYEFAIKYNYNTNTFDDPLYVKTWYEGEDCSYINNYLKEAI